MNALERQKLTAQAENEVRPTHSSPQLNLVDEVKIPPQHCGFLWRLMRHGVLRTQAAWKQWNRFWFDTQNFAQTRLFRQTFGALLVAFYLIRGLDLEYFFSESGMLPLEVMRATMPMDYRFSIFHHLSADWALWTGHVLLIASLTSLALGFRPRLSAAIALVLHLSFMHRNMASVFGIDMIATFYLLYLSFMDEGSERGSLRGALHSMAYRFAQVQVCVIYAYSGLEKLKGPAWWKSEAIWDVLANAQLARFDFSFMSHFPLAIVVATYGTLAWEIYFPVLIWVKKLRPYLLVGGVLLHLSIGVAINIPFFGAVMILTYAFFLTDHQADAIQRFLTLPLRTFQRPANRNF